MNRRQWTLLVVSDDETTVRQYRFPREVVRLAVATVFLVVAALSSMATTFLLQQQAPRQTVHLQEKNELLQAEMQDIQKQVTSLHAHLEDLSEQDEQFRLVAGLEPLSADIQRVGIGGPGGEDSELARLAKLDRAAGELAAMTATQVGELLRRARLLSFSWREAKDTLTTKYERLLSTPSIVPTSGYVTSAFARRRWHPVLDKPRPHEGVDITARAGTPIVAAAKGTVSQVGYEGDYGLLIEIDHGFGVKTRYAHASRATVRRGQTVQRGERIGLVGTTGMAIGPHLHYEVLINGKPTNPRNYFLDLKTVAD